MSDQEQNPNLPPSMGRPPSQVDKVPPRDRRERSGKDPLIIYSDEVGFDHAPCTKTHRTTPSADKKGRVWLEIHRAGLSHAVVSPFITKLQSGVPHKQNRDFARRVLSQDTYARLKLTCKNAIRHLAEGVKRQQEKIDCLLSKMEATKREPRDFLSKENAREARREEHGGRTALTRPKGHWLESRAWQNQTKAGAGE
ncbi:hypothetical protein AAC387_Pa10g0827 [Persea americana]